MQLQHSIGEAHDRASILFIKQLLIRDPVKKARAKALYLELRQRLPISESILMQVAELERLHASLWECEDEIRSITASLPEDPDDWYVFSCSGPAANRRLLESYLTVSAEIRRLNDRRHELVRNIDARSGTIPEPKEYTSRKGNDDAQYATRPPEILRPDHASGE